MTAEEKIASATKLFEKVTKGDGSIEYRACIDIQGIRWWVVNPAHLGEPPVFYLSRENKDIIVAHKVISKDPEFVKVALETAIAQWIEIENIALKATILTSEFIPIPKT